MVHRDYFMTSQSNTIFETIKKSGMNPSDFEWVEIESERYNGRQIPKLIHKPSNYYFIMDFEQKNDFSIDYSPGIDEEIEYYGASGFGELIDALALWLRCVNREFDVPDLWESLAEESKITEAAKMSEMENTPFTEEEQSYISNQLKEVKEYLIKTHNLTGTRLDFIDRRLSYLEEAAKRQGRRDWIHLVIGVLFTIVFELNLPGVAARELFRFVATALSRIISKILSLPLP